MKKIFFQSFMPRFFVTIQINRWYKKELESLNILAFKDYAQKLIDRLMPGLKLSSILKLWPI